ncbi:hypothetical protein E2C01_089330 [Portunus trituberculatus]|uniref:Uncharacterized protein n=1 Tax=Portunus trituberculatus TaxID=210409 RepID=A0A5B7JPA3_PORTR|nr:hypothetical protein [Portunus trituberculatus]
MLLTGHEKGRQDKTRRSRAKRTNTEHAKAQHRQCHGLGHRTCTEMVAKYSCLSGSKHQNNVKQEE